MKHEPTLLANGLESRVRCSCGYRSHWREAEVDAWDAFDAHLAQVRRERQEQRVRVTHRTRVTPWRYV